MHILTQDEIPESFDTEVQLMHLGAGWGLGFDFNQIKKARELGYPAPKYFAVYAVEDNKPLAKVEVIHIEFNTPKGPEIMSGIAGVITRREKSRSGLARELLLDVHKREKASGIRYSLLWTGRNNKAHNLYESLGYVDIYDPGVALRKVPKNFISSTDDDDDNKNTLAMRKAQKEDEKLIGELHSKMTANRLGFTKRPKGFVKILFDLELEKPDAFQIFLQNDSPVGYALFRAPDWNLIRSPEVIMIESEYYDDVLCLLEREARGNWLAFNNSFVSDARSSLERRGYVFSSYTYSTLMACDLQSSTKVENIGELLGANDPRFICEGEDHF